MQIKHIQQPVCKFCGSAMIGVGGMWASWRYDCAANAEHTFLRINLPGAWLNGDDVQFVDQTPEWALPACHLQRLECERARQPEQGSLLDLVSALALTGPDQRLNTHESRTRPS